MTRVDIRKAINSKSKGQLARDTGIHLSHISRVLNGRRTASADNLRVLSEALSVPMEELYEFLRVVRAKYLSRGGRVNAA